MAMTKEDLLATYYEDARSYDLHYSNVRTTLGTFFLTVGFGSANFLYDKYRLTIASSLEQQDQLLYVPLFFIGIAFMLSATFHRLTRACHGFQHSLGDAVTGTGESPNVKLPNPLRSYLKEHLSIPGAYRELLKWKRIDKLKGSETAKKFLAVLLSPFPWLWRWAKAMFGDPAQLLLIAIMMVYWFGFLHMQAKHWLKEPTQAPPLSISINMTPGEKKIPPSVKVSWKRLEDDEAIVYRASVTDEFGVAVCETELITNDEFFCKQLRRAGEGMPLSNNRLDSLRVKVEAFHLELVTQSQINLKDTLSAAGKHHE